MRHPAPRQPETNEAERTLPSLAAPPHRDLADVSLMTPQHPESSPQGSYGVTSDAVPRPRRDLKGRSIAHE